MKRVTLAIIVAEYVAIVSAIVFAAPKQSRVKRLSEITVFFSPNGGCTEAIVSEIEKARSEILVQAYSFTSEPIADALQGATIRQVAVTILVDKSGNAPDNKFSMAGRMALVAEVLVDGAHAIAHNKIMVIDSKTVITGSFNFSASAEHKNAENLLVIKDKDVAAIYKRNFEQHKAHSKPWGEK